MLRSVARSSCHTPRSLFSRNLASEAHSQPDPETASSSTDGQNPSPRKDITDLPPNALAAYLEPGRVPSTHNVPSCQLQLRSYDIPSLTFFADFAMRAAYHLNLPAKGPVPMPKKIQRWTVPRGPFVHKKTQENFERITYKRMIKINDGHPEVVERWLSYLNSNVMPGVGLKANTFTFDSLGVGARMQQARTAAALEGDPQEPREIPNLAAEKAKKILAKKEYAEHSEKSIPVIEEKAEAADPVKKDVDA